MYPQTVHSHLAVLSILHLLIFAARRFGLRDEHVESGGCAGHVEPELIDCTQPEMAKEVLRDGEKDGPTLFLAVNQASLLELFDVLVGLVPANAYDVRLRDGMVVGDDGQGATHRLGNVLLGSEVCDALVYLLDRYRFLDFKGMGMGDRVALRLPRLVRAVDG